MKTEQGLLQFDRLNENAWCFDVGYQSIYLETGMVVSIQLMDDFQRGEIQVTPDNRLSVIIGSGKKRGELRLDTNKRYPARMAKETVDKLIETAELCHEANSMGTGAPQNDTSDLPF